MEFALSDRELWALSQLESGRSQPLEKIILEKRNSQLVRKMTYWHRDWRLGKWLVKQ